MNSEKKPMAYKSTIFDQWMVEWPDRTISFMPDEQTARRCAAVVELVGALKNFIDDECHCPMLKGDCNQCVAHAALTLAGEKA